MNLNHLAIFHAVAQAGSMTLGAERLDISQPAVSKQVQELERVLGVHLFDRIGRRVHLSQAGEILADYFYCIPHIRRWIFNRGNTLRERCAYSRASSLRRSQRVLRRQRNDG
jgi:hypothetical protein